MNQAPTPMHSLSEQSVEHGVDNGPTEVIDSIPRDLIELDKADRTRNLRLNRMDLTTDVTSNRSDVSGQYRTAWQGLTKGPSIMEVGPKNEIRQGSYALISSVDSEPFYNEEQSNGLFGTKGLQQVEDIRLPENGGLIDLPREEENKELARLTAGNSLLTFRGKNEDGGTYYVVGSREAFNRQQDNPTVTDPDIKYIMPGQTLQVGRGDQAWLPKEAQARESQTNRPRISSKQATIINDGSGNLWLENLGHNPISLRNKDKVETHSYSGNRHHEPGHDWDDKWTETQVGEQTLGQRLREALSNPDNGFYGLETPEETRVSVQRDGNSVGRHQAPETPDVQAEVERDSSQTDARFAEGLLKNMVVRLVSTLAGKDQVEPPAHYQPKHVGKHSKH